MTDQGTNHDIESDLADLLGELSTVQDDLLQVLTQKRDFIAAGDLQAMNRLQTNEKNLCARLQKCHDRRSSLLSKAAGQGLPADSIRQLAEHLPSEKQDALQQRAQQTSARMRLLQHQSLTNWVLAQRSLLHITQLLEIVATGGQIQPTYGEGQSIHSRGRLVDQEI